MGYVSKELKAELVKRVKAVLPKGWKASFKVYNYSTLRVMIKSAPIELKDVKLETQFSHVDVNTFSRAKDFVNVEVGQAIEAILDALDSKNHIISEDGDYGNVYSYNTRLSFGDHSSPFVSTKAA